MMLGDMIGTKAGAIVLLDELESRLEQVGERRAVVVDVIENAELQSHGVLPPDTVFVVTVLPSAAAIS